MSSSGSQSIWILRVRFVNIKGFLNLWHEIGIAPSFSGDLISTPAKSRILRTELFERYLYLLLYDAIQSSKEGLFFDNTLLFLRLNTIVADQPQERSFFLP